MIFSLVNAEAVVQRYSVKKMFSEFSQNSQENTCAKVSFLIKLQASLFFNKVADKYTTTTAGRPQACNFIKKETLAQVFSCEFCEISKNTFFHRTLLVAASVNKISITNVTLFPISKESFSTKQIQTITFISQ